MKVEDLFTDLGDGIKLLKLLEIISGEKIWKPNTGKTRIHNVENLNKSLEFLKTKARYLTACLLALRASHWRC
jgi:spectrin beta